MAFLIDRVDLVDHRVNDGTPLNKVSVVVALRAVWFLCIREKRNSPRNRL